MVCGDSWWLVVVLWQLLVVCGGYGGLWCFMVVCGGSWWFVVVHSGL